METLSRADMQSFLWPVFFQRRKLWQCSEKHVFAGVWEQFGISRSTGSILCRYEQGVLPSPDVASVYTEPRTYLTHILQIPYLYLAHVSCLTHTLFTFYTAHIDLHIAHILHIPSTSTFQIVRKPSTNVAHINGLRTFKRLTHGPYISLAHIFDIWKDFNVPSHCTHTFDILHTPYKTPSHIPYTSVSIF